MNLNERLGYQQAIGTNLEALCKLDKRVSINESFNNEQTIIWLSGLSIGPGCGWSLVQILTRSTLRVFKITEDKALPF